MGRDTAHEAEGPAGGAALAAPGPAAESVTGTWATRLRPPQPGHPRPALTSAPGSGAGRMAVAAAEDERTPGHQQPPPGRGILATGGAGVGDRLAPHWLGRACAGRACRRRRLVAAWAEAGSCVLSSSQLLLPFPLPEPALAHIRALSDEE